MTLQNKPLFDYTGQDILDPKVLELDQKLLAEEIDNLKNEMN